MAPTMLVCKQCNYENEPERVYCHNCGAKLDRSLLPPEATKRQDPAAVQARVRKMVKPRRLNVWQAVKNFVATVLVSALLALIVVIARPPADVPTLEQDAVMDAPTISDDLEMVEQEAAPRRIVYKEEQVNAFLAASIRAKDKTAAGGTVKFERVYVHFDDGVCRITTQQSLFGFSMYATTAHTVTVQNGVLTTKAVAGGFGRLVIPGKLMPYVEGAFAPLWKVLERDRKLVAALQSITFRKGTVEMVTRPATR